MRFLKHEENLHGLNLFNHCNFIACVKNRVAEHCTLYTNKVRFIEVAII